MEEKINELINQENFVLYSLSPTYPSIQILEEIFDNIKSDDDPNLLAEQEDKTEYNEFIGSKWIYRYENGKIYSILMILPQAIELIIIKDEDKSNKIVKAIEGKFLKD
tara:strand:- start:218 stop:541 length:324 start_codon:yes stop_codon:yes gene_type:complete